MIRQGDGAQANYRRSETLPDALLSLLRAPEPGSYFILVSPFVFVSEYFLR